MEDIALVYLAAGTSSRFNFKPKMLEKVGPRGETLAEISINQALPAGFKKIIFIVGKHTKEPIREFFGDEYNRVPVKYAMQTFDNADRDRPWGTMDALCAASDLIDGPFVVCNGDDIYGSAPFQTLVDHLKSEGNESATIGYKLGNVLSENADVTRGIFYVNDGGYLQKTEETFGINRDNLESHGLSLESLCNMNLFAFRSGVLSGFNETLKEFKTENAGDRKAECLLPVEVGNYIQRGRLKMKVYLTDEKWYGITNPGDEKGVREALKNR
jgi:NDP-sugar pyrophosphorylase family protein